MVRDGVYGRIMKSRKRENGPKPDILGLCKVAFLIRWVRSGHCLIKMADIEPEREDEKSSSPGTWLCT